MQEMRQNNGNDTASALRAFYLADPLVRFMANSPVRAGLIVHLAGFWSLFLANWLNGSILYSSPRSCDIVFLARPFDWLYIGLLAPTAFWVLAHYYQALLCGVERLTDEGIIRAGVVKRLVENWRTPGLTRTLHWIIRYTIPLIFVGFLWIELPGWHPDNKTIWFIAHDGTENWVGVLFMFLAAVETAIVFGYAIDTVRIALFHLSMIRQEEKRNASSQISFFQRHPDGAFGYGPLANSMNWAGVLGILSLMIVMVGLASNAATEKENTVGKALFDPTLLINLVFCLTFFPWVVFGPVSPFIVALFRRKKAYMCSLREQFLKREREAGPNVAETDSIREQWKIVASARPHILYRRSVFMILGTVLLTNMLPIFDLLLSLASANLSL